MPRKAILLVFIISFALSVIAILKMSAIFNMPAIFKHIVTSLTNHSKQPPGTLPEASNNAKIVEVEGKVERYNSRNSRIKSVVTKDGSIIIWGGELNRLDVTYECLNIKDLQISIIHEGKNLPVQLINNHLIKVANRFEVELSDENQDAAYLIAQGCQPLEDKHNYAAAFICKKGKLQLLIAGGKDSKDIILIKPGSNKTKTIGHLMVERVDPFCIKLKDSFYAFISGQVNVQKDTLPATEYFEINSGKSSINENTSKLGASALCKLSDGCYLLESKSPVILNEQGIASPTKYYTSKYNDRIVCYGLSSLDKAICFSGGLLDGARVARGKPQDMIEIVSDQHEKIYSGKLVTPRYLHFSRMVGRSLIAGYGISDVKRYMILGYVIDYFKRYYEIDTVYPTSIEIHKY